MVYHYILKLTEYLRVCKSDRIRNIPRCMVDLISVENLKKSYVVTMDSPSIHKKKVDNFESKLFY